MAEVKKAAEMTGIELLDEEIDRVRQAGFANKTQEICLLVQTREQIRVASGDAAESIHDAAR